MPVDLSTQHRRRAAAIARAFFAKNVPYAVVVDELGASRDPEVAELVDLITREPTIDGIGGVGPEAYRAYQEYVEQLIGRLAE